MSPPGYGERRVEGVECVVCRGMARFCRLNTCPYYRELLAGAGISRILSSSTVYGPTPPSLLIGERGYPRVAAGPAVCLLESSEPALYDSPAGWLEVSLDRLLAMRLSLFYGRWRVGVLEARKRVKAVETLQESAASIKPVDVEVALAGRPIFRPGFSVRAAPYGPSARAEDVRVVGNVSIPRRVESLASDLDVGAEESVASLYRGGFDEYYITRVFSAGLLGRRAERRVVPTEWSITAVDDILSRRLHLQVRGFGQISEYRLHSFQALENAAHIILTPTPWMYELLEGWLRHSTIYSDHELFKPRGRYAENTGGAYYAVRLPILRHLAGRAEQAGAIVFFEVSPGWIPLGVWRFREIVKRALEGGGEKFGDLGEALEHLRTRLKMPLERYLRASKILPLIRGHLRLE
ncbi:hypothetical protein HRbin01_01729 [archaeon HR01]|nr:hypothetical protein HRbin01_01729 [archaeon HR01]